MPLYDCLLLMKPQVRKEAAMDLLARVGRRVFQRNGVITDIKSFGNVQLGYGIKKLDGRHYQGQLMQMTMMVPPTFNKELQYLNKEDRLLRWLVVKHRDTKYELEFINEEDGFNELKVYGKRGLFDEGEDTSDVDEDEDDDDAEYDNNQ